MALYDGLKPGLIWIVCLVAAGFMIWAMGKKHMGEMLTYFLVAAFVLFFINGPENALGSMNGVIQLIMNFFSSLGG
ncbi:hypothetical protein H9L19_04695 [Weissella diestrammenae]|uniref:Uncharacterized protein n=1 Tax=Weissella diestrammenae TaxID=1162633 RepID=A0A7G9T3P7_9LACO|nr:TcpD family membrane protein [Weissella diestrammenae]MCM0582704.1 hypothetical protein [Weissella diestrammenae]QNN74722.1 hypothetical protein H9L19_04695 [Weissella diestrammenae]